MALFAPSRPHLQARASLVFDSNVFVFLFAFVSLLMPMLRGTLEAAAYAGAANAELQPFRVCSRRRSIVARSSSIIGEIIGAPSLKG